MEFSKPEEQSFTPPWSRTQSLQELTSEAGINFDAFIDCMKENKSIDEMAKQFQVQNETIESLEEYFLKYGISSVIGGD
ncbi:MAG: helix-turn-helix domain-containing protein [Bacillota bacterium]|nr:helix-turn-helix domain-containing protein [Bacillota bacterium]